MKNIYSKLLSVVFILFVSTVTFSQVEDDIELEELVAVYDGFNEELDTYQFVVNYIEDGIEMTDNYEFKILNSTISDKYNLISDEFIGKSFQIKYTVTVESEITDDGNEEFHEVYTMYEIGLDE